MILNFFIDGEHFAIVDDYKFPDIFIKRANYDYPIYKKEIELGVSDIEEACIELANYGELYKKALDKFLKLRVFL